MEPLDLSPSASRSCDYPECRQAQFALDPGWVMLSFGFLGMSLSKNCDNLKGLKPFSGQALFIQQQ